MLLHKAMLLYNSAAQEQPCVCDPVQESAFVILIMLLENCPSERDVWAYISPHPLQCISSDLFVSGESDGWKCKWGWASFHVLKSHFCFPSGERFVLLHSFLLGCWACYWFVGALHILRKSAFMCDRSCTFFFSFSFLFWFFFCFLNDL